MKDDKEALFYRKFENSHVKCDLCPQDCYIPSNGIGKCNARKNKDGRLISLNYGKITVYNMELIEKKPLYHFYPGKRIFSIGTFGCNLKCEFCQNFKISRTGTQGIQTTSSNLVNIAQNEKNNIGVAYTYNEPSIWYEFLYEMAPLVHKAGLKNVLITNGYIKEKPLEEVLPYIDAMNIDLKAFNNTFYKEVCGGSLEPVKDTILRAVKETHVEITTLVVNKKNDSLDEIKEIAQWIGEIDPNIPLHLSRYYPAYQMTHPSTPVEKMIKAREIAKNYLNYVYIGNVEGVDNNTYCPQCSEKVVDRKENVILVGLTDGKCKYCGEKINIIY